MTATLSKKSGKGISHGVVSEMSTFFTVRPGHAEQLHAACQRFGLATRELDPNAAIQKSGLRESRHVIFDNGQRLLWITAFETDWDPYFDDVDAVLGHEHFIDWLQHTVEAEMHGKELQARHDRAQLKALLQAVQVPASSYWDALSDQTVPQIRKAQRVEQAFQQVLDDPAAEQALQQPALQPLLEQAAD